jgi:hypothetical protein
MKKLMTLTLAGLMVLFTGVLYASSTQIRVAIPFDFYAGTTHLSAGDYIVEMRPITTYAGTSTSVAIRTTDGNIAAYLPTMPGNASLADNHLHFMRYGDQYFLSRVESNGYQANLKRSSLEKELLAESAMPQATIIASK